MRLRPRFGTSSNKDPLLLLESSRPQSHEVGGKFDFAMVQVHSLIEINDSPIVRIRNCDRKKDPAGDPLVGAHFAKSFAIRDRLSRVNLNMDHARIQRRDGEYQKNNKMKTNAEIACAEG